MAKTVFRCNICNDDKVYTSKEADEHRNKTGHNSFRMLKKEVRKERTNALQI